ncbi:hypothetical protein ACS0TY_027019 [Phlomoides rotata]
MLKVSSSVAESLSKIPLIGTKAFPLSDGSGVCVEFEMKVSDSYLAMYASSALNHCLSTCAKWD